MEDTSTAIVTSATMPTETTASPTVPALEGDQVEPKVDEDDATEEVDKLAGQAGEEVETSKPTLPNELVDHVLSYLDERNKRTHKRTLAACCRVSRTFLSVARPRHYRKLGCNLRLWKRQDHEEWSTIVPSDEWDLYHSLTFHLSLAKLVQHLTFSADTEPGEPFWEWPDYEEQDSVSNDLWLRARQIDVNLLLQCCSNLQVLEFQEVLWFEADEDDFSFLYTYLRRVVLHDLSSLTLSAFWDKIPRLAPNLRSLRVYLNLGVGTPLPPFTTRSPSGLKSLAIEPSDYGDLDNPPASAAFDWLTCRSFVSLTSLAIYWNEGFEPMPGMFPFLVELSITVFGFLMSDVWLIYRTNLQSLPPLLRKLTLKDRYYNTFADATEMDLDDTCLAHLPPHLEQLTFAPGLFPLKIWKAFIAARQQLVPGVTSLRFVLFNGKEEKRAELEAVGRAQGGLEVTFFDSSA